MLGSHTVATRSKTKSVVATSTGEAEFYATCSAVSNAIGLQSMLLDLGWQVAIRVGADAAAWLAMSSRRGLGSAKHLQVQHLWIQALISEGIAKLVKIPGEVS